MGSKLSGSSDDAIVDINITPFVDVVLVILIIFMVTATYIVRQAIKMELPDAATGESRDDTSLGIAIDAQGELYLDGEPITEDGLRSAVRSARSAEASGEGGEVVCLIAADKTISHGAVIEVIDLVKQEGVARFMLDINPVPTPSEAAGAVPAGGAGTASAP